MLILYETPAGFALFKVLDNAKIKNVQESFADAETAQSVVKLKAFSKFDSMQEAVQSATAIVESKLTKQLQQFLKKEIGDKKKEELAVCDKILGGVIKDKLDIPCIYDTSVIEIMRGIRTQLSSLLSDVVSEKDLSTMALGLSHSLSRYKLKFSPDKVDTMIVQAISLLDDLDKELNIYAMRVREWYGWHFPELAKVIPENLLYAKTVLKLQNRLLAANVDLSDVLPDALAAEVKDAALISMGTEISENDLLHCCKLAEEVIGISTYRTQLFDYLKNRMQAIAPNLTHMVGELVGARLIAHAGSLMNLAKHPASTVQILGAEKALFRALKARHNTPKYGLIFHASLVGQTPAKHKGKIARVLAAKCAISARVDALGEKEQATIAIDSREKVENRIRTLENVSSRGITAKPKGQKFQSNKSAKALTSTTPTKYDTSNDITAAKDTDMDVEEEQTTKPVKKITPKKKTPQQQPEEEEEEAPKPVKKVPAKKTKAAQNGNQEEEDAEKPAPKQDKKRKREPEPDDEDEVEQKPAKKKKAKPVQEEEDE